MLSGFSQGYSKKEHLTANLKLLPSPIARTRSTAWGEGKIRAGDFTGALASLREAEANYAKAEKLSDSHQFVGVSPSDLTPYFKS